MPATKKDLTKKFICPLDGCKGIWTDNRWTYNTHCAKNESHQKALDKKNGVKNGVKNDVKNGVKKLEKEKKTDLGSSGPDMETLTVLSNIPKEVVNRMDQIEKDEYFGTLKVLYLKKMQKVCF